MKLKMLINPKTAKEQCRIGKNGQLFLKRYIVNLCGIETGQRYMVGRNAEDENDKNIYLVKSENQKIGVKVYDSNNCGIISLAFALKEFGIEYPTFAKVEKLEEDGQVIIRVTPIAHLSI
jgi:hypothetical protein